MRKTFPVWILPAYSTSLSLYFPSEFQLRVFPFPVPLHTCPGNISLATRSHVKPGGAFLHTRKRHLSWENAVSTFLVDEQHFVQRNECLLVSGMQILVPVASPQQHLCVVYNLHNLCAALLHSATCCLTIMPLYLGYSHPSLNTQLILMFIPFYYNQLFVYLNPH